MKKFSLVTFLLVLAMITLILPTPARAPAAAQEELGAPASWV